MIQRGFLIFIFGFCLLIASSLLAQPGIYTEEEIQAEDAFLQAEIKFLLGKYEEAEEAYLEVLKKDAQNDAIAFKLSRVYSKMDDDDNFEKYIKKAINNAPTNEWYLRTYARFLENKERYEDAVGYMDKLLAQEPSNGAFLQKHAQLASRALQYDKAISSYNRLEVIQGITEETSRKKFELYASSGKTKQAVEELKSLANAFPSEVRYLNNLASYYTEIGKKKDAKKVYQQVQQLDPSNPTAAMALSGQTANTSEAGFLNSIESLILQDDVSIDKKIMELVPYVSKIGELDDAATTSLLNNLEALESTHPDDAKSYAIYGDAYMGLNQLDQAIPKYQNAIQRTKKVFPVWEQLMYALAETKDFTQLATTADQALNYYPNQPLCYYFLGASYGAQIEEKLSKEDLFLRGMTEAQWKKSRGPIYNEAIDNFEEAMLMSGKNKQLKYKIAVAAAQASYHYGDYKKALAWATKAKNQDLNIKNPQLDLLLNDIEDRLN